MVDEAVRAAYVSVLSRAFTLAAETFTLAAEGPPGESIGLVGRGEQGRGGEGRGEGFGVQLGVSQPGGDSRTTLIPLLDSLQVRTRARVRTRLGLGPRLGSGSGLGQGVEPGPGLGPESGLGPGSVVRVRVRARVRGQGESRNEAHPVLLGCRQHGPTPSVGYGYERGEDGQGLVVARALVALPEGAELAISYGSHP